MRMHVYVIYDGGNRPLVGIPLPNLGRIVMGSQEERDVREARLAPFGVILARKDVRCMSGEGAHEDMGVGRVL